MSSPDGPAARTVAALAARRRSTDAALQRVHDALARLRREKTHVSVAAVARRAGFSELKMIIDIVLIRVVSRPRGGSR
jgi:hypothetical protein